MNKFSYWFFAITAFAFSLYYGFQNHWQVMAISGGLVTLCLLFANLDQFEVLKVGKDRIQFIKTAKKESQNLVRILATIALENIINGQSGKSFQEKQDLLKNIINSLQSTDISNDELINILNKHWHPYQCYNYSSAIIDTFKKLNCTDENTLKTLEGQNKITSPVTPETFESVLINSSILPEDKIIQPFIMEYKDYKNNTREHKGLAEMPILQEYKNNYQGLMNDIRAIALV